MWACLCPDRQRRRSGEHGATSVEYALMLSILVGLIFGAVLFFGTKLTGSFQAAANTIPG